MTYAEGSLWVTGRGTDLLRVDPATGAVQATIDVGAGAIDVVAAAHSIWVAVPTDEADRQGNPFLDRLLRIDPATMAVTETLRPTATHRRERPCVDRERTLDRRHRRRPALPHQPLGGGGSSPASIFAAVRSHQSRIHSSRSIP